MNRKKIKILIILIITVLALGYFLYLGGNAVALKWLEYIEQYRTRTTLLYTSVLYTLFLAFPGVPGVELGLLLMVIFGKPGVIAVYICTVVGLNLSFAIGRLLPTRWFDTFFLDFSFLRKGMVHTSHASWLESVITRSLLIRHILGFLGDRVLHYRYLGVGLLLNLPANWMVGGGGGISLLCGLNRSFSWPKFGFTVVVATCPVPILVYIGVLNIEPWLRTLMIQN
jgi:hypothetical protein